MFLIGCLCIGLCFSGCGKKVNEDPAKIKGKTPMEKVQHMITDMTSYEALTEVVFISNKGKTHYKTKQQCRLNGSYRLEVLEPESLKNTLTISDGDNIFQVDQRINGKVYIAAPSKARSVILLESFVKNYLNGEESAMVVGAMKSDITMIEATIPGDDSLMAVQKLWIDESTMNPIQMVIYDKEGKESIIVNYEEFHYNIELTDDLFSIEK